MSYWYEVIAPVPDGTDDFAWECLAEFQSMMNAISYAKQHEDAKLILVMDDEGVMDSAELPLSGV